MSIVVHGMNMPTNCLQCSFVRIVSDHHYCGCNANCMLGEYVGEYLEGVGRHEGCPLVELPKKHGPLIDRKELEKAVLKWLPPDPCGREEKEYPFETDICVSMMMEIGEQETIVEAEGEEMVFETV